MYEPFSSPHCLLPKLLLIKCIVSYFAPLKWDITLYFAVDQHTVHVAMMANYIHVNFEKGIHNHLSNHQHKSRQHEQVHVSNVIRADEQEYTG